MSESGDNRKDQSSSVSTPLPTPGYPTADLDSLTKRTLTKLFGSLPAFLGEPALRAALEADLLRLPGVGVKGADVTKEAIEHMLTGPPPAPSKLPDAAPVDVAQLSQPTQRIVFLKFGAVARLLSADQVRMLQTDDLTVLPGVGKNKDSNTKAELARVLSANGQGAPQAHQTGDALDWDSIATNHLVPEGAAERTGLSEGELREHLNTATSRSAARVRQLWSAFDLAVDGKNLREIGEVLGVSGERVRRILADAGVTTLKLRSLAKAAHLADIAARTQEIGEVIRQHPGILESELRYLFDIDSEQLEQLVAKSRHLILTPADDAERERLRERRARAVESLRDAAEFESPLSGSTFDRLVKEGKVPGPGKQSVAQLFGTWNTACEAAGVEHLDPMRAEYERAWSDEELEVELGKYLTDPDFNGSADGYEEWNTQGLAPSVALIRARYFTSWGQACRSALIRLRAGWAMGGDRADFRSWNLQRSTSDESSTTQG